MTGAVTGGLGRLHPDGARVAPVGTRLLAGAAAAGVAIVLGAAAATHQVAALIPLAAGLVIAVLRAPQVATLIVVFVIWTNAAVVAVKFHGVPAIATAGVPLLLVVPLIHEMQRRQGRIPVVAAFVPLVAFLFAQVLSALFSTDPTRSVNAVMSFLLEGFALFVLSTAVLQSRAILRGAIWTLVVAGALMGSLSIYQEVTGTFSNDYFGFAQLTAAEFRTGQETLQGDVLQPRLAGPIGEQNFYAQILAVLLPLSLALYWIEPTAVRKAVAVVAGMLCLAGVVLTFSRGAIVGLALMGVVALALRLLRRRDVALIAAAAVLVVLAFPDLLVRLGTLDPASGRDDAAIMGRASENAASALTFLDHPIVGVGPGLFPAFYQRYAQELGIAVHTGTREAHNLYLGLAAETGILGAGAFAAVLGVTLRSLVHARRTSAPGSEMRALATGILLSLVVFLATSLFLHLAYERYFWLLMAVAAALGAVGRPPTQAAAVPAQR